MKTWLRPMAWIASVAVIGSTRGSGNFEDDFLLVWSTGPNVPQFLLYAVAGSPGLWITSEFPVFTVVAAPEPATVALVVLSLLSLVAARTGSTTRTTPRRRW